MTTSIEQEFSSLGEDVVAVFQKPEVLEALNKVYERREAPLKSKRDELLAKISETNEVLKSMGGLDSIKTLAQQAADAQRAAAEAAAKSTDVETVRKTYSEQLAAEKAEKEGLRKLILTEKVDNVVGKAIREAKGSSELLAPHINGRIKSELVEGQVKITVLSPNGVPMLRDDGKEATVNDLINEFKNSTTYSRAFEAVNVSGTGAKDAKPALTGSVNPWLPASKNITQQMQLARSNPELAKSMAAQAGIALNI